MNQRTQKKLKAKAALLYKVIPFERDASYYFERGNRYFFRNNWSKALLFFRKAIEIEPDNAFNHYSLGCMLSKMGQLEEANKVFQYILNHMDDSYFECYFLMAVNFGLMEDLEKAQRYLKKYLEHSPEGEMAWEAHELLWALADEESDCVQDTILERQKEEILGDMKGLARDEFIKKYRGSPVFWKTIKKILYQCCDSIKEELIDIMAGMGSGEARETLREFVRNPWVKDRVKRIALLKLKEMYGSGWCQVFLEGKVQEVDLAQYPHREQVWKSEWQTVLDRSIRNMRSSSLYDEYFFDDVRAIWIDFINSTFPNVPRIFKPETWSAGLEYTLARFHFLNITQKQLSSDYGVSPSSVRAKFKIINDALRIDQKAYFNLLSFLSKRYGRE